MEDCRSQSTISAEISDAPSARLGAIRLSAIREFAKNQPNRQKPQEYGTQKHRKQEHSTPRACGHQRLANSGAKIIKCKTTRAKRNQAKSQFLQEEMPRGASTGF
jgi:hypothetical protein